MTRPKTISDEDLLAIARKLFRAQGHSVSTRQVAESAGISEAVLYQRFGNKDDLFFAAMAPHAPDLEKILGPETPTSEVREYLKTVVARMTDYFGEVLPLALRVITHPSFDHKSLGQSQAAPAKLQEGLTRRLSWFEGQRKLRRNAAGPTARLLISISHDWALGGVMSGRADTGRRPDLEAMIDVIWKGAARPAAARPARAS
jgi:AcrR family transcriptional regulator